MIRMATRNTQKIHSKRSWPCAEVCTVEMAAYKTASGLRTIRLSGSIKSEFQAVGFRAHSCVLFLLKAVILESFHVDQNGEAIQFHPVTEEPMLRYLRAKAEAEAQARRKAEEEEEERNRLAEARRQAEEDARQQALLAEQRRKAEDAERHALDQVSQAEVSESEIDVSARNHREPSPTVNTKAALAAVNDMFGSTLAFDDSAFGRHSDGGGSETEEEEEVSIEAEDFFPPVSQASQLESQAIEPASQPGDFVNNSFWGPVASQQSQSQRPMSPPASQQSVAVDLLDASQDGDSMYNESCDVPKQSVAPAPAFAVFQDEPSSMPLKRKPLEASRFAPLINLMTPIVEQTNEYTAISSRGATSRLTGDLKGIPLLADSEDNDEESPEDVKRLLFKRKASSASSLKSVGEEEEDQEDATADQDEELRHLIRQTDAVHLGQDQNSQTPKGPFLPHSIQILDRIIGSSLQDLGSVGYQNLLPSQANRMSMLRRSAKPRGRRSGSREDDSGVLLELGMDAYSVREKLGEGGFAAVFRIGTLSEQDWDQQVDDEACTFALKVQQPAATFEFWILHQIRSALKNDLRTLRSIILPHKLYHFSDESHLLLEVCDQGTLLDAVNVSSAAGIAPSGHSTGLDELLVMFFAVELLRTLEALHDRRYLHGDVKVNFTRS